MKLNKMSIFWIVFVIVLLIIVGSFLNGNTILSPPTTKNFCLDLDGKEPTTANTAIELNVPYSALNNDPNGDYTFSKLVNKIVVVGRSGNTIDLKATHSGKGDPIGLQLVLFNDEATSATIGIDLEEGEGVGKPGSYKEYYVTGNRKGPIRSAVPQGNDDNSFENPCKYETGEHELLAGTSPTSIAMNFKGVKGGNLPVSYGTGGSVFGTSIINGDTLFINSNAEFVRLN